MRYEQVSITTPSGTWTVNVNPKSAIDPNFNGVVPFLVTVIAESIWGQSQLTPAGKAAVIAEFDSYLSSSNLTTQHFNTGSLSDSVGCELLGGRVRLSVLSADAATVAAAVVAILQTAANVT